ncbi:RNA polymerase sigma factor [Shewanella aestuarii]|uniref:RNA polymerase sigma factor n=1 Tax=Shewanella aestuarii TaxID=1028752 RepID=A0A6G9QP13_9GAMM|nr:RNA polymerase sigma factor [Shewanella aestuarii]QIR16232.1 RNA polymerase sigma factor [Shewanella aestuarii]
MPHSTIDHFQSQLANDNELVALASQGDQQAFKALYQRHHCRVYAICLRLCHSVSQAEEITQNCFVRLWQKLPLFKGESLFTTWLHRLCVRQAINDMKAQQTFWQRFIPHQDVDENHQALIMPAQECHQLDKLLARLPQRTRIVFVLCAIEGYQHDEIAKLLNIAVGTSKAQYHRAKQLLQEMMK